MNEKCVSSAVQKCSSPKSGRGGFISSLRPYRPPCVAARTALGTLPHRRDLRPLAPIDTNAASVPLCDPASAAAPYALDTAAVDVLISKST